MLKKIFILFILNIFIFSLNSMPMEAEVIPLPEEPTEEFDLLPPPEIDIPEPTNVPVETEVLVDVPPAEELLLPLPENVPSEEYASIDIAQTEMPPIPSPVEEPISAPVEIAQIELVAQPVEVVPVQVPPPPVPVARPQIITESTMQQVSVGLPVSPEELEINKQKQALEQLKIDIDSIEQQEENLMAKINELENQFNQAKGQELGARQTKAQILNAQTVEQAQELLNQLNMVADQIQGIQASLQGPFSQEFTNVVSQIQNKIQNVNTKMNVIKNKSAAIILPQKIEPPVVVKKKVKIQSTLTQRVADVIAFVIDSFVDMIDWIKNWFNKIFKAEENIIDKIGVEPTQIAPIPQESLTADDLTKKFDDQMMSYEKKIGQLSEKKKQIKQEEMQIEEKKKLLAELKTQKAALKKYQELMKQLGLSMEMAREEKGEIRNKLEFAFGKVLDFGSYVLEKIGIVSSGIYNRIFLPRLEKFVLAVKQRVEEDGKEEVEVSPPPSMDMTIQSTGMEPLASIPPQPIPQMPMNMPPVPPSPMSFVPMPEAPPPMS
ncbi:MAG: hypothetical protein ABIA74_02615 [bacterium]